MKNPETTSKTKWSIDQSHSEITFKVRHLMIAHVKGGFKTFDASIYTDEKDFSTVEIDLWIDTKSINTHDEKRDEHMRSVDFFDVQHHSQITFTSSTIGKANKEGIHELWGELTMRGVTKTIKLDVQFGGIIMDPWGNEKTGFTVTGVINRTDWGLAWNTLLGNGGLMVGEEVTILCEIELVNIGQKDLTMELEPAAGQRAVV